MVKLITVVTHSDGYLPWLEKSCKRFNIELIKLGYGQKWLGFSWRFKLISDYLKVINPNELIIIIDAYDVIVLRPLDHIEEYYNNILKMTNKKIIISEDKNMNKFIDTIAKIYFGTCKDTRICAGSYLGKAKYILGIFNKLIFEGDDDDQVLLTSYFNKYPEDVYIDTDNIFFLTRNKKLGDILEDKNIKVVDNKLKYMNSRPFFIHGNDNTYMHNLILKLGYKISNKEIKKIIHKYKQNLKKKIYYYHKIIIKKYKILLCILFLFLFLFIFIIYYLYKIFIKNKTILYFIIFHK
jgi:hypothetical protein